MVELFSDESDFEIEDVNQNPLKFDFNVLPKINPPEGYPKFTIDPNDVENSTLCTFLLTIRKCPPGQVIKSFTNQTVFELKKVDYETLYPKNHVNDSIINAFMCQVMSRSSLNNDLPNVCVFETSFWSQLNGGHTLQILENIDIGAQDMLIIPIQHSGKQWLLIRNNNPLGISAPTYSAEQLMKWLHDIWK